MAELLDLALANQAATWKMKTRQPTEMTVAQAKAAGLLDKPKRNKFGAIKTPCNNGHVHHSALEAKRCDQLHLLQKGDRITGLRNQPEILLQAAFRVNGKNERAIVYRGDFSYFEPHNPRKVIEDVKGDKATRTAVFEIKRRLLLWRHEEIDFRILTKEDIR